MNLVSLCSDDAEQKICTAILCLLTFKNFYDLNAPIYYGRTTLLQIAVAMRRETLTYLLIEHGLHPTSRVQETTLFELLFFWGVKDNRPQIHRLSCYLLASGYFSGNVGLLPETKLWIKEMLKKIYIMRQELTSSLGIDDVKEIIISFVFHESNLLHSFSFRSV